MKFTKTYTIALVLSLAFNACSQNSNNNQDQVIKDQNESNIIQLALLLDVSGSMDGLIDQAKSELWSIVNEVAKAKKQGQSTQLEIALYEYGRSNANRDNGYVTKLLDYTSDLDKISEVLFSLRTNGGDEYCGHVIKNALEELQWRGNDSIYRVIFIAGNEPFNQGNISFKTSCANAKEKDIFVNTIHCGDSLTGVREFWYEGAELANGKYFFIDHNARNYDVKTPFDSLIGVYNDSLNMTYLSYGNKGMAYRENQLKQDENAKNMSSSVKTKRAVSKSSKIYNNSTWDVTDAYIADTSFLEKTKEEDLPQILKGKTSKEKKAIVVDFSNKRSKMSKNILNLNIKREEFLKTINKNSGVKTLGSALIEAIHFQANSKGFVFE
ncbi:MAG: vWA domain-containing protein [Bacteroidota bacterium]|nr:vWA domain-containing protein [Bacteroidota bacterium]